MAPHPRRSIPVSDDDWAVIQDIAEDEDRSPYTQAARMLRHAIRIEQRQRHAHGEPVAGDDDLN
jgi:hypothetical protein